MAVSFLYIIYAVFYHYWTFKDFLINMIAILIVLAKLATRDLLKLNVFQNKGYGVVLKVYTSSAKCYHVNQFIV